MHRSSKIVLAILAFLLVYFIMVYVQLSSQSRKDFVQADADNFLKELALAFEREDTSAVTSFAWPDATVAGQQLTSIRNMLHNGFMNMKSPKVGYANTRLLQDGSFAHVQTEVSVTDGGVVPYPPAPVTFKLERRTTPHLGGLVNVYEWKVVNVDAQLPAGVGF
jgi:hypothetical protein